MKTTERKLSKYKFRAEMFNDCVTTLKLFNGVLQSLRFGGRYSQSIEFNYNIQIGSFGEPEVEIISQLTYQEIKWILERVQNGHVMVQSLSTSDSYTGNRDGDYDGFTPNSMVEYKKYLNTIDDE